MTTKKIVKICFIDFYAYPLFNPESKITFGGSQVQLFLLANELSKNSQFEISFLTDDQKKDGIEKYDYIEIHKLSRSGPIINGLLGSMMYLFEKLSGFNHTNSFLLFLKIFKKIDSDIYIQRAAGAETGIIAIISKIFGRKFIYMIAHKDDVSGEFIKKNGFKGKLFNLGLKLADKIICQNKEQLDLLPKNLKNKSIIIKSAYEIEQLRFEGSKEEILWVGRSETWKRPELFLELAKKIPQEKFTMILTPADANKKLFEDIKEESRNILNLNFIPGVPFKDVNGFFKKAKIFINTSTVEGFPNTFVQAAKNGTPIISLSVNPDDIITKYDIGYFAKNDTDKLVSLVKNLSSDKKTITSLSKNAVRYSKENHDIKKISEQYKQLFLDLFPNRLKKVFISNLRYILASLLIISGIIVSVPTIKFFFAQDPQIKNSVTEDLYGGYISNKESVIKNDGFELGAYGLYLSPQKHGELIYKFNFEESSTPWTWLYMGFNGMSPTPGKASISKDGLDYTPIVENAYVNHLENKFDISSYAQGNKTFYLKIEAQNINLQFAPTTAPTISQTLKPAEANPPAQILYKLILKSFESEPPIPPPASKVAIGLLLLLFGITLFLSRLLKSIPVILVLGEASYLSWYYFSKIIYTRLDADAIGYKNYAQAMTFNLFNNNGFYSGNFNEREPFFVLITKLFFSIFGPSETHTRLLTITLYIAGIYLLYLVARRLFGKIWGILAALTMTFNIPLILDSSRGMRLELEIFLILALVWFIFCVDWKISKYKIFAIAGFIGGLILLTRFINIFGILSIFFIAAILHSNKKILLAVKLFLLSAAISILLFIPHKYGIYKVHNDPSWDVNVNMRWNANVEFADKPGFPTKEDNGKNPYAGPKITASEYFFKLHSSKEVTLGMLNGYVKIIKNYDVVGYPWLVQKYLGFSHGEYLDYIFQISGILGIVAIIAIRPELIWIPFIIPAFLTPSSFFYNQNLIEQYRHTFQVFPIFSLAAIFFISGILRKTKRHLKSWIKKYEIIITIRKDGKEKIINFRD